MFLTTHLKLEVITRINGALRKQMCLEYGIEEITVCDIFKQRDKLMSIASMSDNSSAMEKSRTIKNSCYEEMDTT